MPIYMVERILPGATMEAVEAIQLAAHDTSEAFRAEGKPVFYLRSTFTPGESCCRCLFVAPNANVVREINDAAQLPYNRIVLAVELPSEPSTDRDRSPDSNPVR